MGYTLEVAVCRILRCAASVFAFLYQQSKRQYLYFCTSKEVAVWRILRVRSVGICIFVPLKQVKSEVNLST